MRAVLLALVAAGALSAGGAALATPSQTDRTFATKAAQIGAAEVQDGQLATQKATWEDVRRFGRMLVSNHRTSNAALEQIAQQENLRLPTRLDAAQQAQYRRLAAISGSKFDTVFPRDQIAAHQQAIAVFQREARGGHDPALKSFATRYLPMLREHLKAAQTINQEGQQTDG